MNIKYALYPICNITHNLHIHNIIPGERKIRNTKKNFSARLQNLEIMEEKIYPRVCSI